jgi:hypothetical protein
MLSGLYTTPFATEPLTVDKLRTGEVDAQRRPVEPVDRFASAASPATSSARFCRNLTLAPGTCLVQPLVPSAFPSHEVASEFAAERIGEPVACQAEADQQLRVRIVVRVDPIWQLSRNRIRNIGSVGATNDRKHLGLRHHRHGHSLSSTRTRSSVHSIP